MIGITAEVFRTQEGDLAEEVDDGPWLGLFDIEPSFAIGEITKEAIGVFDGVDEGAAGTVIGALEKVLKQRGIGEERRGIKGEVKRLP